MRVLSLFAWGLLLAWAGLAAGAHPTRHQALGTQDTQQPQQPQAAQGPQPNSGLHNPLNRFNVASARWLPGAHLTPQGLHEDAPITSHALPAPGNPTATATTVAATAAGVTMDVQPRMLHGAGGQWFTVSWSGVESPAEDDLLALYVPADADITKTAPVKFKFCSNESSSHLTTGSGSSRFWLINYRQDMAVVLMRGGLNAPVALVRSPVISVLDPNTPTQIHLARTRDPTQMVVQWTTHNATNPIVRWGPCQPLPKVQYGHKPQPSLWSVARAVTLSYTREEMCGGAANSTGWINPGLHHRALITGLKLGRCYQYRVGDDSALGRFSQVYRFPSAPRPSDTVHILAMADVGQGERDGSNLAVKVMQPSLNTTGLMADDLRRSATTPDAFGPWGNSFGALTGAAAAAARGAGDPSVAAEGRGSRAQEQHRRRLQGFSATASATIRSATPSTTSTSASSSTTSTSASSSTTSTSAAPSTTSTSASSSTLSSGPDFDHQAYAAELDAHSSRPPYDYSLVLHEGDLSYAEGFGSTWDNFFHQLEPLIARLPYMVSAGNHERDWPDSGDKWGVEDSGGECGVPYRRRIAMPLPSGRVPGLTGTAPHFSKLGHDGKREQEEEEDEDEDQPWFSFDHGPVHIIHYSTEHEFGPGSAQYAFLEADLKSVDRSVTPWLVLAGHRPIYISSNNTAAPAGDQVVAVQLRASLEPLLQQYGVDLTLSGHHHSYQRTCAVFDGVCFGQEQDAVAQAKGSGAGAEGQALDAAQGADAGAHESGSEGMQGAGESGAADAAGTTAQRGTGAAAVGGGGDDLQYRGTVHLVIGHGGASLSMNQQQPPPIFLVNSRDTWGYLRLHISRTELHAEVVSDVDGGLMDEFRLSKTRDWGSRYMAAQQL